MTFRNITVVTGLVLCGIACSCKKTVTTTTDTVYEKISPDFDADSAYTFVDKQVAFGYRVPNTKEHAACGDYLVAELKRLGAEVQEQKAILTAYDGTKLDARNIIGSYGLDKKTRVLLFAHWDTRAYSDQDKDPNNHKKPLLGANDGGSGVGVLLEMARIIQTKSPEVGVDIIFFDAEDYGTPEFVEKNGVDTSNTWCLGSQYWAKNPHTPNYKAKYGILLDMVGAPNATFYQEEISRQYAPEVVEKIWGMANKLNYKSYFINQKAGALTDDHVPVNRDRNIPSVDIVDFDPKTTGFGTYWHTQQDDMSNVSKATLKAVGQTVLEVIYNEKQK